MQFRQALRRLSYAGSGAAPAAAGPGVAYLGEVVPAAISESTMSPSSLATPSGFELRFESLFQPGRALAFPCDAGGRVELDALSDRARRNYLYARAVVGREYANPAVVSDLRD